MRYKGMKKMIKKMESEVMDKKPYVSVWVEMLTLDGGDIVTTSKDPDADNDITKDDIFG